MRRFLTFLGMVALLGSVSAGAGAFAGAATAAPRVSAVNCYPACVNAPNVVNGSSGFPGQVVTAPPAGTPAASPDPTPGPSGLAFTGADIAGTVALALAAVAAGVLLVRFSRRRQGLASNA